MFGKRIFCLKFKDWQAILFYRLDKGYYGFRERLCCGYCRNFYFFNFTLRIMRGGKNNFKPLYQAWTSNERQSGIIFESNSLSCVKAYIREKKHLNLTLRQVPKAKD